MLLSSNKESRHSLFRSFVSVIRAGFLARIVASIRDSCEAFLLGASSISDCYFVLSRITSLLRAMFSETSLSSTIVPRRPGLDGDIKGVFYNNYFYIVCAWALCLSFGLFLWISMWNSNTGVNTQYLAIIFALSLLFAIINGYLAAILQCFECYARQQLFHVILSIFTIIGGVCFGWASGFKNEILAVVGMALGAPVAGCCTICINFVSIEQRFENRQISKKNTEINSSSTSFFVDYILSSIGGCINKINSFIDSIVLYIMSDGNGVSYLNYTDHIFRVPFVVFGIGLAQVATSIYSDDSKFGNGRNLIPWTVNCALTLMMPMFIAFVLDSESIVRFMLKWGKFDEMDVRHVSRLLSACSMSLPPAILSAILMPIYFAKGKSKFVLVVSIFSLIMNVALDVALVKWMGYIGVGYASAIVAWVNVSFILMDLSHRNWIDISKIRVLWHLALAVTCFAYSKFLYMTFNMIGMTNVIVQRMYLLVYFGTSFLLSRFLIFKLIESKDN